MKKIAKVLAALGCILTLSVPGVLHAREIQSLNDFSIPAYQGIAYTSQLTKAITNAPWVMNLNPNSNCKEVDTGLINSNGELRSNYARIQKGLRYEIPSSGTAGYWYRAFVMNSKSSCLKSSINGSWSPDNR